MVVIYFSVSFFFKNLQKILHFEVRASRKTCQKNAILNMGAILNFWRFFFKVSPPYAICSAIYQLLSVVCRLLSAMCRLPSEKANE
jgi:hypothetical protein